MATEADLQRDLTAAMKARSMDELYVLRGLMTAIKNAKVEKMVPELGEAEIVQLVRKEINQRTEAIEFAEKAGRTELVQENERRRAVLERYLPRQLAGDELERIIRSLADELGSTAIGPIMTKLRERYAGQFDGQVASGIVKRLGAGG